ncbi:MAG: ATP-binding protein [Clostridiales bacterium]|nr:ATP-binding protein [Clostridiales bacterium]
MDEKTHTFRYTVHGEDFLSAGEASMHAKRTLKELGYSSDLIRRVSVAMYEGEINMFIHAGGGEAKMEVGENEITVTLIDWGAGIPDVDMAMREGYSTATADIRSLGFGAGMGLPNMKRFADELTVSSTVGVGTKVVMRFAIRNKE